MSEGTRKVHPKKRKQYKSKESYRKFCAYVHIRTPAGKKAKYPSQTISAKTPKSRKEPYIRIGKTRHKVEIV